MTLTTLTNHINHKNLKKVFLVILDVIHILNGTIQNVHERYTMNEVVEHKFFSNIPHSDNRFYKPFQKQATARDGKRVCLFCLKVLFYLSHWKRLQKSLVEVICENFSKIYENIPVARN